MVPALPELDTRLAALRESLATAAPPPATDQAIATAVAKAARAPRRAWFGSAPLDGWMAWPLGLAAAITVLSFIVRAVPPHGAADTGTGGPQSAAQPAPAAASFMPVVPLNELERAGDALVIPARLSRLSLAQLGLPVNPARAADAIETELLVRSDGAVLAVRFIN